MANRLRVMTLNIWNREGPWEARRELIRRGIMGLGPDLVGLQEVLELKQAAMQMSLAAQICEGTPYQHVFSTAQVVGPGLAFGNALLTTHPVLHHETFPLPGEESGESRSVLYAVVATPVAEVPVFVTHLNWKLHHGSVRVRQVKRLVELVTELAPIGKTFPPIVMGDFNAEPESDEIRFMRGFATLEGQSVFFADAWVYGGDGGPGYTFDRRNPYAARAHEPPRRIDYIFVRGPDAKLRGEPITTRIVCDEPVDGVWPSDHFGLYTEISV